MSIDTNAPDMTDQEASTPSQPAVTISAKGLSKHFIDGEEVVKAVDAVSFTCETSQFVAVTGPSGCGKSTLLYLLGSLEKPTDGELLIDGVNVVSLSGSEVDQFRRTKIGFVFQSFHLIPNLSALENVMLALEIAHQPRASQRERAAELLTQVGIDENRFEHRPAKLSGGQQQRVAIARALANNPSVILADEPTGNLDTKNSKRIIELLRQLAHQGRTIVVVTHDNWVAKQADVRIELEDGQIAKIS